MQMLPESAAHRQFQRQQASRMVRKWNACYGVGTRVKYWRSFGEKPIETQTSSAAELVDGQPVILLEQVIGRVSLYDVLPDTSRPAA